VHDIIENGGVLTFDKLKNSTSNDEYFFDPAENITDTYRRTAMNPGVCIKMQQYKCMKQYSLCTKYENSTCVQTQVSSMQSLCTKQKKVCCAGYREIKKFSPIPLDQNESEILSKIKQITNNKYHDILEDGYFDPQSDLSDNLECERVSQCGGLYHLKQNTLLNNRLNSISTANYPGDYPSSLTCEWHIEAPEGSVVELNLGYIEIESNKECRYDKLRVWDDSIERVLCGSGRPQIITSHGNSLHLRFTSDQSGRFGGFKATYKFKPIKVPQEYYCEAPLIWLSCAPSCNTTCADIDPFNPDARECDYKDLHNQHKDRTTRLDCVPGCACPPHKPVLEYVNGVASCIVADQCEGVATCGVAPEMNTKTLQDLVTQYSDQDVKTKLSKQEPKRNKFYRVKSKVYRPQSKWWVTQGRWKTRRNKAYGILKSMVHKPNFIRNWKSNRYQLNRSKRMAPQLRILGGEISDKGTWPWMAQLFDDDFLLCGASLVCSNWVITAAHCFLGQTEQILKLEPHRYRVMMGRNYRRFNIDEQGSQSFIPAKIFTHPDYSPGTNLHDIAMIALPRAVRISKFVRPICLPSLISKLQFPSNNDDQNNFERYIQKISSPGSEQGKYCWVAGWGQTKTGDSVELKQAPLRIRPSGQCQRLYLYYYSEAQMCAGGHHERDTCQGDSGGPLMCSADQHYHDSFQTDPRVENYWVVQGVTSYGSDCGEAGQPGGYTRVSHYMSWINMLIGERCGLTFRDHEF